MIGPGSTPAEPPLPLPSRRVSLALQGGASLGAYTWGVLDALLEDGRLEIEGVTGASAGAINAAALGVGFIEGGRSGARACLRRFWEELARAADGRRRGGFDLFSTLARSLWRPRSIESFYALTTRLVSDVRIDPETIEPLRSTIAHAIDLSRLRERVDPAPHVFINVTDVQSGQPMVFTGEQIDVDVVCASCAVPLLVHPVVIHGRRYWDGSLVGNPAIYPVIGACSSSDVVLVETVPLDVVPPRTAAEVVTRTIGLTATAGLTRELRAIELINRLAREAPGPGHRPIRIHRVPTHPGLAEVEGQRSFRADLPYFHRLRDLGREAGLRWLTVHAPTS